MGGEVACGFFDSDGVDAAFWKPDMPTAARDRKCVRQSIFFNSSLGTFASVIGQRHAALAFRFVSGYRRLYGPRIARDLH